MDDFELIRTRTQVTALIQQIEGRPSFGIWAVRAYEKGRKAGERPVFVRCLSTAVASAMGAPIVE